jgi:hypothetical protein
MSPIVDPRLKIGAYVRLGTTVYHVLCLERDDNDCVTGMFVLENIHGEHSCGTTYVHRRTIASASTLTTQYQLVLPAPETVIPDYLDAQFAHLDIAP